MNNRFFESADEIDRVFYPFFCVSAQRPVTETEAAADKIDRGIERKQELIANVASKRQPLHVLDNGVEFVAVYDQNSFAGRRDVDGVSLDVDVSVRATEVPDHLVVITRDIDDARAFACFAQNFLNDVVMGLRPVTAAAHRPDVDQVADYVEVLKLVISKKVEQDAGVRAASAEMHVGNPGSAHPFYSGRFIDNNVRSGERRT